MKSIRLTNVVRASIKDSVVAQYREANPLPPNGDVMAYIAKHVDIVPQTVKAKYAEYFDMASVVYFNLDGEKHAVSIASEIPDNGEFCYRNAHVPAPEDTGKLKAYFHAREGAKKEAGKFARDLSALLEACNTTKQLLEVWPELEEHIPEHIVNPSTMKLPAIRVCDMKEKLGRSSEA